MKRFGTGIGKMNKLMKEYGLSVPEFSEEGDFVVVKCYPKYEGKIEYNIMEFYGRGRPS